MGERARWKRTNKALQIDGVRFYLNRSWLSRRSQLSARIVGRTGMTMSNEWYYCDAERDPERYDGPVSLDRLAELIGSGKLPYDVLVSTTKVDWEKADTVERILRAIPIDRERIIREYIVYGETEHPEWGWASHRMYSILNGAPEIAWELIVELVDRAPSENSLGFFAAGPLEDLLSEDGRIFIDRVEDRARRNEKFRRALGMLRRLGMTDDVWNRVQAAARGVD